MAKKPVAIVVSPMGLDKSMCNRDAGIDQQNAMCQAKQQMKDCMQRMNKPAYDKIMNVKYRGDNNGV